MLASTCGNNIVEADEECDNVHLTTLADRVCIPPGELYECTWWDNGTYRYPSNVGSNYYGWSDWYSCESRLGYPTYCDKCGDGIIGPLEDCEHALDTGLTWPENVVEYTGCNIDCTWSAGYACDNNIPSSCWYCRNYTSDSDEEQLFCNDWNL